MSAAFDKFFKENYQELAGVDRNTAALMRISARQAFANCWNAALAAALESLHATYEYPKASEIISDLNVPVRDAIKVSKT